MNGDSEITAWETATSVAHLRRLKKMIECS